ncbi:hypothetical protein KKB99_00115 [bacterium]|nr:hypothetical protein [bacterium]MBU1024388.1 hypothetical protein [bacterium]
MIDNIFPEDNTFLKSITDHLDSLDSKFWLSNFLFPWEISLARNAASGADFKIEEWGGFKNSLRKRLIFAEHKIKQSMFNITPIEFKPYNWIAYFTRKAVLDAFSQKGVPSELIGDIHKSTDCWLLMIDTKFSNIEFDNAAINASTNFPLDSICPPKEKITGTTASVRLDSICSIAFEPSRGKLKGLIENSGAMIDYRFVSKAGREVKEGSIISLRGFPRFKLCYVGDVTKKGRTRVTLELID